MAWKIGSPEGMDAPYMQRVWLQKRKYQEEKNLNTNAGLDYVAYDMELDRELLTNVFVQGLSPPNAVVFCVGGGGSRSSKAITEAELPNTTVVAVNSHEEGLKKVDANKKLLVGRTVTFGKDAGGFPEVGEKCFEAAEEEIKEAMCGSDVVYIISSLGGGFGTGVAPKIARAAKEDGRVVVSLVSTPFSWEDRNNGCVDETVEELRRYSDSTVVTENDDIMIAPAITVEKAFSIMDRSIVDTIRTTSQLMETQLLDATLEEELPRLLSHITESIAEAPSPRKEEKIIEEEKPQEMLVTA